jgi:hypothetical protein
MSKKAICICTLLAALIGFKAHAQTIYETFDTDPTSRGWINDSAGLNQFKYKVDGYVDAAEVHRDSANTSRYWKSLDLVIEDTQEFWLEIDIAILNLSNSDFQSSLLGLFGNTSSNTISFVGTRFAYDN